MRSAGVKRCTLQFSGIGDRDPRIWKSGDGDRVWGPGTRNLKVGTRVGEWLNCMLSPLASRLVPDYPQLENKTFWANKTSNLENRGPGLKNWKWGTGTETAGTNGPGLRFWGQLCVMLHHWCKLHYVQSNDSTRICLGRKFSTGGGVYKVPIVVAYKVLNSISEKRSPRFGSRKVCL